MQRDKRIDAIKYYGIIGMCLLHSSYLLTDTSRFLQIAVQSVGGVCLPLYFFLSAFFISQNFNLDMTANKVTARIKSVLVPFFIWNLLFIIVYSALGKLQTYTGLILTHETYFPRGIKEITHFMIAGVRNPPLWYLWVLMEFVLITPCLFALFRERQKTVLLMLLVLAAINLMFYGEFEYASVFYWIPIYGAGMWCGIFHPEFIRGGGN